MRTPIEAIPVTPGSSRKVEQKTTGASSGVLGASSGVLVTPNQETFSQKGETLVISTLLVFVSDTVSQSVEVVVEKKYDQEWFECI